MAGNRRRCCWRCRLQEVLDVMAFQGVIAGEKKLIFCHSQFGFQSKVGWGGGGSGAVRTGFVPRGEGGTASSKVGTHCQTTTLVFGPVHPSVFFFTDPQNHIFSMQNCLQKRSKLYFNAEKKQILQVTTLIRFSVSS